MNQGVEPTQVLLVGVRGAAIPRLGYSVAHWKQYVLFPHLHCNKNLKQKATVLSGGPPKQ